MEQSKKSDKKDPQHKIAALEIALAKERQKNHWLRRNLETYRGLVENLNDVIYATDANATITYVSPNVKAVSEYTPSEIVGSNFVEFVHPEDRQERMSRFLKSLEGATEASEYRFITKTGKIKWFRTSARPVIENGKVAGVQGVLVDITERKKAEEALRISEEKYRQLVENAKDAIIVIQDEIIRFANPVAGEMAEIDPELLLNTDIWSFVHPEDLLHLKQIYEQQMANLVESSSVNCRLLTVSGQPRHVDMKAVSIKWEDQPAVLCFIRDITMQRELEKKLQAIQKLESIGTLAGGIAHNFNNLLMGIQGNLSLALLELEPDNPVIKKLRTIETLVFSGSKLTSQLLGYARGGRYSLQEVNLHSLIMEVAGTLGATRKDIMIEYDLSSELDSIEADQGQMEQMLFNLLINAADAMPEGGRIVLKTTNIAAGSKESRFLSPGNNHIRLDVTDTGAGMDEDTCKRIFEPFFTTKEMGRGTGLGLASVYGIVKGHRGHIEVDSTPGRGTTFSIFLPVLEKRHPATEKRPAPRPEETFRPVAGCCRPVVMVVDDEKTVLDVMAEIIQDLGYRVMTADSGRRAIALFKEHMDKIKLVILDLVMPQISGEDVFHALREMNPDIKIVLASGYDRQGRAATLLTTGGTDFIQKPFDIDSLNRIVQRAFTDNDNLNQ